MIYKLQGDDGIIPGYYVHLATVNPKVRENRSFIYGVEMPDLLKKYFKTYGLNGAKEKYESIKTNEMPDFSTFKLRIQQTEKSNCRDGLHYGLSSNPDFMYFWNNLNEEQKKNPFYIGYLWHLLTDLLMYTYLDIEAKIDRFTKVHADSENLFELKNLEYKKLHNDWNKTNSKICDMYPDVILPPEIQELGIVKFVNEGQLSYVDWKVIQSLINYMRAFNPLEEDINAIIENFINLLPQVKSDDFKEPLSKKLVLCRKENN